MKIIFRADGDSITGLGHIMRSAAVMRMVQSKFDCEFWTYNPSYFPIDDFNTRPVVVDLGPDNTNQLENEMLSDLPDEDIVVLDGYKFDTVYQQQLKKNGNKVVCIDDIMAYHFVADAVVNHAGGLQPSDYSCEAYTRLFLGPEYALIRPLFYAESRPTRDFANPKLLISLGGADPENRSDGILETLLKRERFSEIHIVLGPANRNKASLQSKWKSPGLHFHQSLSGKQMFELMYKCDQAVLSPSTVCYEYMALGGLVYLYQIADNQQHIRQYFTEAKLAFPFEELGNVSRERIELAMANQRTIFNGKSAERLRGIFTYLAN